jgi:hypothetical protein
MNTNNTKLNNNNNNNINKILNINIKPIIIQNNHHNLFI